MVLWLRAAMRERDMGYQSQMGYRLVRDDGTAGAYIAALFALPGMLAWEEAARLETGSARSPYR
jgi:hypothetical protein